MNNTFQNFEPLQEFNNSNTYEPFQNTPQNPTSSQPPFNYQNNYNSKIYIEPGDNPPSYDLYLGSNQEQNCFQNSLAGIQELTPLSIQFFSKQNADLIQTQLIERVFTESNGNYRIGRQSDLQLQIIMRSTYLSYGKNSPNNIENQIRELNQLVADEAVGQILPNIQQYLSYRHDISTPRHIISHPINPSSAGEKTYSLLNI